MSTINKTPFIKRLLASCSSEELATLSTLVDGGGNQTPLRRTANPIATENIPHITSDDMGIHLCNLTINYTNFLGYLIYTDDYCALVSFTDAQVLKVFDLTESKVQPDTVDEAINILELRSALYEARGGEGGGGSSSGTRLYRHQIHIPLVEYDENDNETILRSGAYLITFVNNSPTSLGTGVSSSTILTALGNLIHTVHHPIYTSIFYDFGSTEEIQNVLLFDADTFYGVKESDPQSLDSIYIDSAYEDMDAGCSDNVTEY